MTDRTCVMVVLLFCLSLGACASSESILSGSDTAEQGDNWDTAFLTSHLIQFNGPESEGRGTGTRGYFRSADYVASRLREYGLQPVLQGEYRQQIAMTRWAFEKIRVMLVKQDTVRLIQGQDFLMYRSAARLHPLDEGSDRQNASNHPHLIVSERVKTLIEEGAYELVSDVDGREIVTTSPMHISGFIPGRSRSATDSLIVIMAPLDGLGLQGGTTFSSGADLGIAPSALLEVSRRLSKMQEDWAFFGPTVLVQFISGTTQDCQGASAAWKHLPWDKQRVKKVVVLEETSHERCNWKTLAANEGVRAPLVVFSPKEFDIAKDVTMPFYPLVRRDLYLRAATQEMLIQETKNLASRALSSIVSN